MERLSGDFRIPPDLVALLVAAAMWLAAKQGGALAIAPLWRWGGVSIFLALGIALIAIARVDFARRDTTFSPVDLARASTLVVDGVYRLTRNPMYLGSWCVLFALAVYWSNWIAALVSLGYVVYIDRFQIRAEERILALKFGGKYDEYRRRVRRWL